MTSRTTDTLDRPAQRDEPATEAGREQAVERSQQIIAAAYDLLEEGGLEGLTIRAVLARTGLSRRAFYERFSGKDDLVLAVFEQTIRLAAEQFGDEVRGVADPMARLKVIVSCIVLGKRAPDEDPRDLNDRRGAAMSREHLRLAESRPAELQAALRPLIALIEQQLSDGMQVGVVRTCAPQPLAVLVYNLVSTTVHTELLAEETAQPDRSRRVQLAADIWEFCRRAIAA